MTVRRLSAALTAAAAGLLATGLMSAGAAHASTTATPQAAALHTQTAGLVASTRAFPHSAVHTGPTGAINLTENGTLQRYVNRSDSPRPAVTTTSTGTRLRTSASTSWVPNVAPSPVSTATPGAVRGWQGLNEHDNARYAGFSLEPPDQGLCAGNGYVFEMINDVVRVYTSSGASLASAYLNDFFNEPGYQDTTDPSCVYDAGTGRFFATELTLDVNTDTGNLTGNDWLDLAVSKTGNPLDGWNSYRINTTDDGTAGTPAHTSCPCIGDYPHLATDRNGVFLTTNEYPFSGAGEFGNGFNGAQIYALSKSAAVAGTGDVNVVHFENVRVPSTSGPQLVGFTLWPAQAAGTGYASLNGSGMYFTSSFAAAEARPSDFTGHGNQLGVWSIGNTGSLNSTSPRLNLRVQVLNTGDYGLPPLSEQQVGPTPLKDCLNVSCRDGINDQYAPEQEGPLDSSDTRILTAVYANGQVYTALDTAMIVSNNVQAGVEWFSVNANGVHSSLAGNGYMGATMANLIMPSIATDMAGNGYVGMTLSGRKWYPSAVYTTWSGGTGPAVYVAGKGKAPEDGFCEYLFFNCAQTQTPAIRPRWGDYGYAAWDGSQFYVANEYIAKSCTFTEFNSDSSCGGTRTFYGNFSTHIEVLH